MGQPAEKQPEADPVLAALRCAPMGPPETEEERRIVEEARARGEWIPSEVVSAEIAERCRRGD